MKKGNGVFADTIVINIEDASWTANRLEDFAAWTGITPYKSKKLKAMAKKIRRLCDEVERCGNCENWTKDSIEPRVGTCLHLSGCHSKWASGCPFYGKVTARDKKISRRNKK